MGLGRWLLLAISILSSSPQKQKTPADAGGRTNVSSPYLSSSSTLGVLVTFSLYIADRQCPQGLACVSVGLLKALLKMMFLLVLTAAVAGVIVLVKRPKNSDPVTYDEWPTVAESPAD
jgi:hypothetical protein